MDFFSTIQVLKVDMPVTKKGKDGSDYTIYAAQTALLDDNGELQKVGRLRIPESMREKVKVGIFRASFSLEVAAWGQNKGDVIASLTDLVPVPPGAFKRMQSSAAAT
ncbi:MAG: hypothetical protein Q8O29_08550 [Polaromonas sp.]|uniref:hypothetical protein n=1 Tax=Polaromonas sp. TaxID=1869339 RepID=UPI002732D868|nr:hypothetical protein [Polaromonas sp.]MDP2818315.1 hypothetical protein [Polaromonas sp.]